jgi:ADP-ribose pyrophosphatase YjhB (NUDIX family)
LRREPPPRGSDFHASLGAGAILIHRDSVLLVQINYGRFAGQWMQPGGTVARGEHPSAAAEREFKEETGLAIRAESLLGVRHRAFQEGEADVFFLFRAKPLEVIPNTSKFVWNPKELQDVKFWKINDALHSTAVRPFTKMCIRMGMAAEVSELETVPLPEGYEHDDEIFGSS